MYPALVESLSAAGLGTRAPPGKIEPSDVLAAVLDSLFLRLFLSEVSQYHSCFLGGSSAKSADKRLSFFPVATVQGKFRYNTRLS